MLSAFFLFLIGGFLGFLLESIYVSIKHRRICVQFDALFHTPFLPIYGLGALLLFLCRSIIPPNPLLTFVSIGFLLSLFELISGWLMEIIFRRKLWTYQTTWNVFGYADFFHFVLWGILGTIFLHIIRPFVG